MRQRPDIEPSMIRAIRSKILISIFGLITAFAAASAGQQTSEPPRAPILRIEIGRHTAPIRSISTDTQNRFLVTGSDDKTARVWDLATGRLLRVLRPPISTIVDGQLLAVALSPDGNTVAVGGRTGFEWDASNCIYLFDRESGRLLRRIVGLPEVIYHLTYSPDGRWMAATLLGKKGIYIYEASGYTQINKDTNCDGNGSRADFDSQGRIVTSCSDGAVRLYQLSNEGLRLIAKRTVLSGSRPFGVKFAPDGSKIAIGFRDSMRVVVVSAQDLTSIYEPRTSGAESGTLWMVAWSADGRRLYAGGGVNGLKTQIRDWADNGRGDSQDIRVAASFIYDLVALRDGGVVYATTDPSWGRLDAEGRRSVLSGEDTSSYSLPSDMCGLRSKLHLSPDGMYIQFPRWKSDMQFSVLGRELGSSVTSERLASPLITGLNIIDWCGTFTPKLNGKALLFEYQNISSQSLAIAPDYSRFAVGTEFGLYLFDRNGKKLWLAGPMSETVMVNVSGDGKLITAGSTDGTIRWHRITDGKELLAFFPHPDGKRWVLWTPSGYYDASPGAEELIG
ncbi:MAG: hypothetical protein ABIV48_08100, partial [Pyrinomonadaceae bacterium]